MTDQRGEVVTTPAEGRPSLAQSAYESLRAQIVLCRLEPGRRLTERALAVDLGSGVGPVREALKRLQQEGLVRTLPRKGYVVTPLSVESVDGLFDFWRLIGPELVRLGLANADIEQRAQVHAVVRHSLSPGWEHDQVQDEALLRGTLALEMFELLADSAGNAYLQTAYRRISGDLARLATMMMEQQLQDPDEAGALEPVLELVLGEDAEAAARAVLGYIDHVHRRVVSILA